MRSVFIHIQYVPVSMFNIFRPTVELAYILRTHRRRDRGGTGMHLAQQRPPLLLFHWKFGFSHCQIMIGILGTLGWLFAYSKQQVPTNILWWEIAELCWYFFNVWPLFEDKQSMLVGSWTNEGRGVRCSQHHQAFITWINKCVWKEGCQDASLIIESI